MLQAGFSTQGVVKEALGRGWWGCSSARTTADLLKSLLGGSHLGVVLRGAMRAGESHGDTAELNIRIKICTMQNCI